MSEKFHILRENGLFYSPLGPYDPTQEKWSTMREYLEDVLTKLHPESKLIEATTEREITYQQLYLAGEKVAAALTASIVFKTEHFECEKLFRRHQVNSFSIIIRIQLLFKTKAFKNFKYF